MLSSSSLVAQNNRDALLAQITWLGTQLNDRNIRMQELELGTIDGLKRRRENTANLAAMLMMAIDAELSAADEENMLVQTPNSTVMHLSAPSSSVDSVFNNTVHMIRSLSQVNDRAASAVSSNASVSSRKELPVKPVASTTGSQPFTPQSIRLEALSFINPVEELSGPYTLRVKNIDLPPTVAQQSDFYRQPAPLTYPTFPRMQRDSSHSGLFESPQSIPSSSSTTPLESPASTTDWGVKNN